MSCTISSMLGVFFETHVYVSSASESMLGVFFETHV